MHMDSSCMILWDTTAGVQIFPNRIHNLARASTVVSENNSISVWSLFHTRTPLLSYKFSELLNLKRGFGKQGKPGWYRHHLNSPCQDGSVTSMWTHGTFCEKTRPFFLFSSHLWWDVYQTHVEMLKRTWNHFVCMEVSRQHGHTISCFEHIKIISLES